MGSCCDKEPEMLHALQKKHGKVLWVVLAINLIMFAAELITGYLAGSTAVLADSLDMLGDSLVYGFGIFALGRSQVWQVRVSRMKGLIMFGFGCAVIVQAIYKFAQISIPDAELMGWIGLLAECNLFWSTMGTSKRQHQYAINVDMLAQRSYR